MKLTNRPVIAARAHVLPEGTRGSLGCLGVWGAAMESPQGKDLSAQSADLTSDSMFSGGQ